MFNSIRYFGRLGVARVAVHSALPLNSGYLKEKLAAKNDTCESQFIELFMPVTIDSAAGWRSKDSPGPCRSIAFSRVVVL